MQLSSGFMAPIRIVCRCFSQNTKGKEKTFYGNQ
jgi:hypothetical protein